MDRRPLLAGNWKMHTNQAEAVALARAIADSSRSLTDRDVMIAPPYTALSAVAQALADSPVILGAQNVCWAEKGAFTGEIAPAMLADIGCRMALVGHSERRHIFGENNTMINQRLLGAMQAGLTPVLCIGETLEEREANRTMDVLKAQVTEGLTDVTLTDPASLVVAYEPVWAIGTGKTASVEQAQEAHFYVRNMLEKLFEKSIACQIRILYGGSVNPQNVDALMGQDDVDGALVGGAALKVESFARIIHFQ